MDKDAQTDLFPWILGALLIAVAIPAVLAFTKATAPPVKTIAVTVSPAPPTPIAATVPVAIPPSVAETAATAPNVVTQTASATRPALPAGQVWQCVANGQKVFSDSACGDGATIRQLSDVNGMDPPLPLRAPRYPGYAAQPGYMPSPVYDPAYDAQQSQSANEPVYSTNPVILLDERRRPDHAVRPQPHNHPHPHVSR